MNLNFNVKVSVGPRTKTTVSAHCTATRLKVVKFANGEKVSSRRIAEWLETELLEALKKIEEATP